MDLALAPPTWPAGETPTSYAAACTHRITDSHSRLICPRRGSATGEETSPYVSAAGKVGAASLLRLPQALNKHTRRPSNLDAPANQAVPSVRYRYNVARPTPRNLAMSLAVWPSAFIRFAVSMCWTS